MMLQKKEEETKLHPYEFHQNMKSFFSFPIKVIRKPKDT